MIDYSGLWKMLIYRNINKTSLISNAGISTNVLARMSKGEYVSLKSLEKICLYLQCDLNEIVRFDIKGWDDEI